MVCLLGPGYVAFGQSWTVYNPSNSGLPDGDLKEVLVDPANKPWAVTRTSGIAQLDGTTWRVYKSSNSGLPANSGISSISMDLSGALYVGYANIPQGFFRFDGNNWKKIPKFQSINIEQMKVDRHGTTWVCSILGNNALDSMVMRGTGTTFTQVELGAAIRNVFSADSLEIARCFAVGVDDLHDRIWFGLHNISVKGYQTPVLARYTPSTNDWQIYPYDITYKPWPITEDPTTPENLQIDLSGAIWSSLNGLSGPRGLFHFDGTTSVRYTTTNSGLPDERVNALKLDKQERLWVATPSGLARFDGTDWLVYNTTNSGLPTNVIRDIDIDAQNRKWLATDRGLVVLNDITPAIHMPNEVYLCDVTSVSLRDVSSSIGGKIVQWAWDLGDGQGQSDQREPEYVFKAAGDYTVKLTVWDEHGSVNTTTRVIHVLPGYSGGMPVRERNFTMTAAGQLSVDPDFITYPGMEMTFQTDEGVTPSDWNFGDGNAVVSTEATALHTFSSTGTFTVKLTSVDDRGCPGVSTVEVTVLDPLITDTVTPNGDGKNDNLYIVPLLYAPELRVVNRWGQEVHASDVYTDGFSTGSLQDGFYYYEVSFKDTGKAYKGYFQVIR